MQTLKQLLTKPLEKVPSSLVIVVLVIGVLGFVDSTYLTIEHFRNVVPPCTLVDGCEDVLTSSYSEILGIPVALFGVIYYLLLSIGAFAYLDNKNEKMFRYALLLTIFGFLGSLYFTSIQAFVLNAYCLYCLLSALGSTILFILMIYIFKKYRNTNANITN
jgi:uncharacterized membrane protein